MISFHAYTLLDLNEAQIYSEAVTNVHLLHDSIPYRRAGRLGFDSL